jgi:plastocyanin
MDRSNVRRGALPMVVFFLVAFTACGGDDPVSPGGGGGGGGGVTPTVTTAVTVQNNSFTPAAIQVSPGAMITWTWSGTTAGHNITFAGGQMTSSTDQFQTSGTYQAAAPATAGTFSYACTNHGGMTGTITVQ